MTDHLVKNQQPSRWREMLTHVPNAISLFRLLSSFVLIFIFKKHPLASFVIFSLAAFSDFFDGYVARAFNTSSKLGAILDPLADKVLIIAMFTILWKFKLVNGGVAILVLLRDIFILITVAFCFIKKYKLEISPILISKINTFIQLLFIGKVFLRINGFWDSLVVEDILCTLVVGMTVCSGIAYGAFFLESKHA